MFWFPIFVWFNSNFIFVLSGTASWTPYYYIFSSYELTEWLHVQQYLIRRSYHCCISKFFRLSIANYLWWSTCFQSIFHSSPYFFLWTLASRDPECFSVFIFIPRFHRKMMDDYNTYVRRHASIQNLSLIADASCGQIMHPKARLLQY